MNIKKYIYDHIFLPRQLLILQYTMWGEGVMFSGFS